VGFLLVARDSSKILTAPDNLPS
jgi:hypothetical protein